MTAPRPIFVPLMLVAVTAPAYAQTSIKHIISLEAAKAIASAAETEAARRGSTVVIVVVDDGGYPILLHRLDDT